MSDELTEDQRWDFVTKLAALERATEDLKTDFWIASGEAPPEPIEDAAQ